MIFSQFRRLILDADNDVNLSRPMSVRALARFKPSPPPSDACKRWRERGQEKEKLEASLYSSSLLAL
jgi:hypothetical protein